MVQRRYPRNFRFCCVSSQEQGDLVPDAETKTSDAFDSAQVGARFNVHALYHEWLAPGKQDEKPRNARWVLVLRRHSSVGISPGIVIGVADLNGA